MDERGQFTFYRSYWDAIKKLPNSKKLEVIEAILDYCLYNKKPTYLTKSAERVFNQLLPMMDTEKRQAKEGRRCAEYKAWRLAVFVRDDYTCQRCMRRGVKLNAHHIEPYAHCYELRYVLSNGLTLCEECRKKIHKRKVPKNGMD